MACAWLRSTITFMQSANQKPAGDEAPPEPPRASLSWIAMLGVVFLTILIAAGCAYLLVNPFFHQHAP